MNKQIIMIAVLIMSLLPNVAQARELKGYVSNIIDVDIWEIGDDTVQMWGIVTPGYDLQTDSDFIQRIEQQLDGRKVSCISSEVTGNNSDYEVMKCEVGGFDISRMLVRQGFARDCPKITNGLYTFDEKFALEARGAKITETFPIPRSCQ